MHHQRSILLLERYAVRISPRLAFLLTMTCHGFPQRFHAKVGSQSLTSQSVPTLHLTLRYTSYALLSQVTATTNHHHLHPNITNTRKQIYTRQLFNNKSFNKYPDQQPTIPAVSLVSLVHCAVQCISLGRRLK